MMLFKILRRFTAIHIAIALCFCQMAHAQDSKPVTDERFDVELIVDDLPKSWSINLAPDQQIYVADRGGNILVFDQKWQQKSYQPPITDIYPGGQGGFLDIAFHPNFESNGWIYLSYSSGSEDANRLKVVRFKLPKIGNVISKIEDVFVVKSDKNTPVHYGGRLAFMADNSLLISTGDGFDFREQAQVKSSHLGKILRVSDTGQALADNPFYNSAKPLSHEGYIYSLGHRNPQALLVTETGSVISHEHGPAGGDEINIIKKGANYGWPIITNGRDYSGALITPFTEYEGMQQPDYDWTPSIAPSGMILYKSSKLGALSKHLVVSSLKFKQLRALMFDGTEILNERILLPNFPFRLRDIEQDSEGNILLLTDGESGKANSTKIYKLVSE
ncbi:PQQ-dependent sugar dehydrogenase [Glaciecola sp. MF2-115]|uniref:PQQ-dependent sugar dehydrogenase n=1 Tax=Glaciecola sp. MF2-115 TaxID=3384827 RepID=UPI0039A15B64